MITMLVPSPAAVNLSVPPTHPASNAGASPGDIADECIRRIRSILHLAEAADVDLAIEAVFEDMELKKDVLATLDSLFPPGRLFASNTSTLSLTELARATAHPEQVVGLHFFHPAQALKLLEIVRSEHTSPENLAAAFRVAKLVKKVGAKG